MFGGHSNGAAVTAIDYAPIEPDLSVAYFRSGDEGQDILKYKQQGKIDTK